MKEVKWRWKDVAPDLIPVQNAEGRIGLLTEDEWEKAVERAEMKLLEILEKTLEREASGFASEKKS